MLVSQHSFSLHNVTVYLLLCLCLLLVGCSSVGQPGQQKTHSSSPTHPLKATQPTPTSTSQGQQKNAANQLPDPVRLIVPSANINAAIEHVGVTSTGDLATPSRDPWNDAGWYASGSRPGDLGSAVIDGHLDRPGGLAAVFWNLKLVRPGDEIIVLESRGIVYRFRVNSVSVYTPQTAPLQTIFARTGGHFLNLITCAGTWIPSQHQTTQRLIVYATLVS